MNDEWRPISKCPEYEVNRRGEIRRIADGKMAKIFVEKPIYGGYVRAGLYPSNKRPYTIFLHRVVAEAFIPNPDGKRYIHHKDGNRENNSVENLAWVTSKEHGQHHKKY